MLEDLESPSNKFFLSYSLIWFQNFFFLVEEEEEEREKRSLLLLDPWDSLEMFLIQSILSRYYLKNICFFFFQLSWVMRVTFSEEDQVHPFLRSAAIFSSDPSQMCEFVALKRLATPNSQFDVHIHKHIYFL